MIAPPYTVGLASPFLQLLLQPVPQRLHSLRRPGKGLRFNILRFFKADVLIHPGLDTAVIGFALPLQPVAKSPERTGIDLGLLQKIQGEKIKMRVCHASISIVAFDPIVAQLFLRSKQCLLFLLTPAQ